MKALLLFTHELKLLLKDRQALGLLFAMPLAFIVFLTLALQDVYLSKVGRNAKLEVVAAGGCAGDSMCGQLVSEFRQMGWTVEVREAPSTERTELQLLLPQDIAKTVDKLKSGQALAEDERIQLVFDPVLDQSLRALVNGHLRLALQAVLIEQVRRQMQDMDQNLKAVSNAGRFEGLVEERAWGGQVLPNPIQQTVPAWALFGMFFIVIPMANSMIRDRRLGVFKRLLSFPVSKSELLAGKILPFLLINIVQFIMMFAVGVYVLPHFTKLNVAISFPALSMLAVTFVCALTATSYGLMISTLTRTPEQASAFGALSVVILAILGGVMIPRFVMPAFMQKLAQGSPLYWGLESYQDLLVRQLPFTAILSKLAVLVAFSAAFLLVSRLRFRWSEV